jgi:hypothetical protein
VGLKEAWLNKYTDTGTVNKTISVGSTFNITTDDPGVVVSANSTIVTNDTATKITKVIKNASGTIVYDSTHNITNLDTSSPNTYTISYTVTYNGEVVDIDLPKTRIITVVAQ